MSLTKRNPPTEKQLAAYRLNRSKSKGPATPEANASPPPTAAAIRTTSRPSTSSPRANAQHLVRAIAWQRIHQFHYWRFETAIIDANKPCAGVLSLLSCLDYACSKPLAHAIISLETGPFLVGMIKTAERTQHIVESKRNSLELEPKTEPIYPHFRRQRPPAKPNPDPITPEKTIVSHA